MDLAQLKMLIADGESENLEFKTTTGELRSAFETVCAFLNGVGGTVLFGVTDKGELKGQDVADSTKQSIAHEIHKLEPHEKIDVEYISLLKEKKIIVISVKAGLHAPHTYDGRAFQREQSVTKRMPQQRYDMLISKRNQLNYSWESFASEYEFNSVDQASLMTVVRNAVNAKRLPESSLNESAEQILKRLKLLKENKLLNAAIVLFGTDFLPQYPQCQLKLARFKGLNRHEFLDNVLIYGNAFELLDYGMAFVRKHLPVAAKVVPGKLERVETPLIPFEAIREAFINAICHRDYSNHGGSIGIAIYDDRMEIFNNGGLQHGISLELIKTGYSELRNPLIAEVFYKNGLIEKWGRGIQEIISSCVDAGDPEPKFSVVDDISFSVQFKFPNLLRNVILQKYSADEIAKITKLDINLIQQLNERQREIVVILNSTHEVTVNQIAEKLSNPPTERMIRNDLLRLESFGLAGYRGKTKSKVWFIKNP